MEGKDIKEYIRANFKHTFSALKVAKKMLNPILQDMEHITKYESYGKENPDKTFYIIRWDSQLAAFGGLVNVVIAGIIYALDKNWIPVVDFKTNSNCYLPSEKVGTTNVWEWVYEQPCGYTLEDIKRSKNIRLSPRRGFMGEYPSINGIVEKTQAALRWQEIYKKYIRLHKEALACFSERRLKIICDTDRVLAVKLRGTDYGSGFGGHPRLITTEENLIEIRNFLEEGNFNKIFLSCEDETIVEQVRQEFGDKVVMNETLFKKLESNETIIRVEDDQRKDVEEYMSTLWIASQCDGIYGVACGGTMMLWYMADSNITDFKIKFNGLNENAIKR